jgi:hypothetical protein
MQKKFMLLFCLISFLACDKSTRVSGKITNVDTGEPMKDFIITLESDDDQREKTYSDVDGNYSLELTNSKNCNLQLYVYRLDCERQTGKFFEGGGDQIFDYQFKYEGSSLELKIVNSQNSPIRFYSRVKGQDINPTTDHSLFSEPYPLIINPLDSLIYIYNFPGNENIYLDFDLNDIKGITNINRLESYIYKNTTKQYEIRY